MGDMADYYREQEEYAELFEFDQIDRDDEKSRLKEMLADNIKQINKNKTLDKILFFLAGDGMKKKAKGKKPILVKVGNSLIDPNDVAAIQRVKSKRDLYVIRLKSQPNAEFPIWAVEADLGSLLEQFEIIEAD